MENKICTKCKVEQDINSFYIRRSRNNQPKSICKKCESIQKAKPIEIVPDLDGEIWKDIIGFEGIYVVSDMGRVKRITHRTNPTNRIINPVIRPSGYYYVYLTRNGKGKYMLLSRLVGIAFIPNPENKPEVNHLNGKDCNKVEFLEWNTSKENIKHAWETGLCKSQFGVANGNSKLTEKDILEIRESKLLQKELAIIYNVSFQNISDIIRRKIWNHI